MKVKHLIVSLLFAAFLSSAIGVDNTLHIGKKAPKIETQEGINVVADANSEGKQMVVSFWSPKNPSSRIANKNLSSQYGEKNQETIFISICSDPDETLMKEVSKQDGLNADISYSFSQISSRVFKDYDVENHPRAFLIGTDGKISQIF
ncbi:MAG: redoxin domain-containing protein [Muribaculaceae bacterium]|nr:redoxin domain-containing protein [Muribaculaceae bacterium]